MNENVVKYEKKKKKKEYNNTNKDSHKNNKNTTKISENKYLQYGNKTEKRNGEQMSKIYYKVKKRSYRPIVNNNIFQVKIPNSGMKERHEVSTMIDEKRNKKLKECYFYPYSLPNPMIFGDNTHNETLTSINNSTPKNPFKYSYSYFAEGLKRKEKDQLLSNEYCNQYSSSHDTFIPDPKINSRIKGELQPNYQSVTSSQNSDFNPSLPSYHDSMETKYDYNNNFIPYDVDRNNSFNVSFQHSHFDNNIKFYSSNTNSTNNFYFNHYDHYNHSDRPSSHFHPIQSKSNQDWEEPTPFQNNYLYSPPHRNNYYSTIQIPFPESFKNKTDIGNKNLKSIMSPTKRNKGKYDQEENYHPQGMKRDYITSFSIDLPSYEDDQGRSLTQIKKIRGKGHQKTSLASLSLSQPTTNLNHNYALYDRLPSTTNHLSTTKNYNTHPQECHSNNNSTKITPPAKSIDNNSFSDSIKKKLSIPSLLYENPPTNSIKSQSDIGNSSTPTAYATEYQNDNGNPSTAIEYTVRSQSDNRNPSTTTTYTMKSQSGNGNPPTTYTTQSQNGNGNPPTTYTTQSQNGNEMKSFKKHDVQFIINSESPFIKSTHLSAPSNSFSTFSSSSLKNTKILDEASSSRACYYDTHPKEIIFPCEKKSNYEVENKRTIFSNAYSPSFDLNQTHSHYAPSPSFSPSPLAYPFYRVQSFSHSKRKDDLPLDHHQNYPSKPLTDSLLSPLATIPHSKHYSKMPSQHRPPISLDSTFPYHTTSKSFPFNNVSSSSKLSSRLSSSSQKNPYRSSSSINPPLSPTTTSSYNNNPIPTTILTTTPISNTNIKSDSKRSPFSYPSTMNHFNYLYSLKNENVNQQSFRYPKFSQPNSFLNNDNRSTRGQALINPTIKYLPSYSTFHTPSSSSSSSSSSISSYLSTKAIPSTTSYYPIPYYLKHKKNKDNYSSFYINTNLLKKSSLSPMLHHSRHVLPSYLFKNKQHSHNHKSNEKVIDLTKSEQYLRTMSQEDGCHTGGYIWNTEFLCKCNVTPHENIPIPSTTVKVDDIILTEEDLNFFKK
ncbi:hypothetical protein BCR36DRAFT_583060 [Piromyces finnis]|uniref:Uncharacterized protein n=1 Tax=Piromyces finnis TaxID=1754191 RepID=A0A1Y1VB41_9FUNG|nr:hypothetical protein BCR36DRAFT_583060 [Piromyces finnis]|eukprot:ORX51516.1 hypothetical protein BCR36DRAFT_583060 [Piromyces finnis]